MKVSDINYAFLPDKTAEFMEYILFLDTKLFLLIRCLHKKFY